MTDLKNEITRMAEETVELFQDRAGGSLDFSEESLQAVEELLDDVSDYYPDFSSEQAQRIVRLFGCYILEVAQRAFGGQYFWYDERDQPVLVVGEPDYRIAIIAWDKVHERLSGDPANNIPFFYAGFAERVRSASPGARALYV